MSEHKPFTAVYKAVCGWQSVLMVWDAEMEFYEPFGTGFGPYGDDKDRAVREAKDWAEAEQIEYREGGA